MFIMEREKVLRHLKSADNIRQYISAFTAALNSCIVLYCMKQLKHNLKTAIPSVKS